MPDHHDSPQSSRSGRSRKEQTFSPDRTLSHAMKLQLHLNDYLKNYNNGNDAKVSPDSPSSPKTFNASDSSWGHDRTNNSMGLQASSENESIYTTRNASATGCKNCLAKPASKNTRKRAMTEDREIFTPRTLPIRHIMSKYIDAFFKGNGTLLHFVQEVEIMDYFCVAYSLDQGISQRLPDGGVGLTNGEFCLLLLVAAVGAQYVEEDLGTVETRERLFNSGKWYLDIAFGTGKTSRKSENNHASPDWTSWAELAVGWPNDGNIEMLKMSASGVAGLYLIFEKSMVAATYLEQAIRLAQARNLHKQNPHNRDLMSGFPMAVDENGVTTGDPYGRYSDGESWKRVWKSLVFLDGWLSSSVGSHPINDTTTDLPYLADEHSSFKGYNDANVGLQTEMAKLGSLMNSITRDICLPNQLDLGKVREYWMQLNAWHESLPQFLRLTRAISEDSEYTHKTSILLTHCAYLGSIILLTRRVLVTRIRQSSDSVPTHLVQDMDEFSSMCLSAARQLATVVGLIFQEGRLARKCWLGIQSAFSSCLMIFLDLALARRDQNSLPSLKDMELVSICLASLEYCAVVDSTARTYMELLVPIRNILVPNSGLPILLGRVQRPQIPQHRSSSYPSSAASACSSISGSPSASPSKRPRLLPSRSSNSSQSVPTTPSYGSAFQQAGSFNRINTTDRIDQIFSSDEEMISSADPRIHLLVKHITECIESPFSQRDKPFGQEFSQVLYGTDRRSLDLKSKTQTPMNTSNPYAALGHPTPHHLATQGVVTTPAIGIPTPTSAVLSPTIALPLQSRSALEQQSPMQSPMQPSIQVPVEASFRIRNSNQDQQIVASDDLMQQQQQQQQQHIHLSYQRPLPHPPSAPPLIGTVVPPIQQPVAVPVQAPATMMPMQNAKQGSVLHTAARPGGKISDMWIMDTTSEGADTGGGAGGGNNRRRKMPFRSMKEYENFLKRVA